MEIGSLMISLSVIALSNYRCIVGGEKSRGLLDLGLGLGFRLVHHLGFTLLAGFELLDLLFLLPLSFLELFALF